MAKLFFKIGLFFAGLILLIFLGRFIFEKVYEFPQKITYGITFSPRYAKYLKLDWKQTYTDSLEKLSIRNLRIPTYWEDLEPEKGQFKFEDVDFMLSEAHRKGAKIILVLGMRQPRWPECYIPRWAKSLSKKEKQKHILKFIREVVERYNDYPQIEAWQVENEPLLRFFGECDAPDKNFLKEEIKLVRSLSAKAILISDSGELGFWVTAMQSSDIFGTTLYRDVYNPLLGYINYPILPYLYNLKSQAVKNIFAPKNQKTIIVELQAEPWLSDGKFRNASEQAKLFPVKKMEEYINYAKKTGFETQYLWGVEWWFWMAQNGYPQYLNFAKTLFK